MFGVALFLTYASWGHGEASEDGGGGPEPDEVGGFGSGDVDWTGSCGADDLERMRAV